MGKEVDIFGTNIGSKETLALTYLQNANVSIERE